VATLYNWRRAKAEDEDETKRQLKALAAENARLRKIYAEFISNGLQAWTNDHSVELRFIQPGKPSRNGLIERLNKTLRVECLNLAWFRSLDELNEQIQA
jgi:transposase InsO family protein